MNPERSAANRATQQLVKTASNVLYSLQTQAKNGVDAKAILDHDAYSGENRNALKYAIKMTDSGASWYVVFRDTGIANDFLRGEVKRDAVSCGKITIINSQRYVKAQNISCNSLVSEKIIPELGLQGENTHEVTLNFSRLPKPQASHLQHSNGCYSGDPMPDARCI